MARPPTILSYAETLRLVSQYPTGATATELARRACGAAETPKKRRAFAGFLGLLAARGVISKRGGLFFPAVIRGAPSAPMPPPGWYPTPHGPRYWDGLRWL